VTPDRPALLLEDIADSPGALRDLARAYADPAGPLRDLGPAPRRLLFTGLGSSRYAAMALEATFRAHGIETTVGYASARTSSVPAGADLTVLAISASGGTAEVCDTARRYAAAGSRVIAVTGQRSSVLARSAALVLPLLAGSERAGVATRTFRATVAVLDLAAHAWSGEGVAVDPIEHLGAAAGAIEQLLHATDEPWTDATDLLDGAPAIDVLADPERLGIAEQAALMLRECPRLPAVASETADWLHTGVYLAYPGHRAVLIAGSAADAEVLATIARRGGRSVVVGAPSRGADLALVTRRPEGFDAAQEAIVLSVVAELLAARLWSMAAATDKAP
jgi:glucosamine--fructose-6-phosphate aminotransferase (isomerizing)